MQLCIVQHDDRSDSELRDERQLMDLNRAVCQREPGCRYIFTRLCKVGLDEKCVFWNVKSHVLF